MRPLTNVLVSAAVIEVWYVQVLKTRSGVHCKTVSCTYQVPGFALVKVSAIAIFRFGECSAELSLRFRSRIKSRVMN